MQKIVPENDSMGKAQTSRKQLSCLIKELENASRWNLSSKKEQTQIVQKIFEKIKKAPNLNYLWLQWNGMQSMVSLVTLPQFNDLKIMNLGGNNIVSVQPLCKSQMPSLEQFWLWNNNLTRVDSIRKMSTPKLRYLDLSSNCIYSWARLGQLGSKCLQMVNIERNHFTWVDNFVLKLQLEGNETKESVNGIVLSIMDNDLITVFGQSVVNKKKRCKAINFHKKQLQYC